VVARRSVYIPFERFLVADILGLITIPFVQGKGASNVFVLKADPDCLDKAQLAKQESENGYERAPITLQSSTPSFSATVKMSLSPRPHRFISTMLSFGMVGATFATAAIA
jgi:hypothetical protein